MNIKFHLGKRVRRTDSSLDLVEANEGEHSKWKRMREGALMRLSQIRKRWFCSTFCWTAGWTDSLEQVSPLQCRGK